MAPTSQDSRRSLLGLRRKPGRLALALMHLPLHAYAHDQGRLLGNTFLQLTHVGRRSGREYRAVAMVLRFDRATGEAVVCAAWDTDWLRNLQARPATGVTIGRRSFTPEQRFLGQTEAAEVVRAFCAAHPHRVHLISRLLGWDDLRDEAQVQAFVAAHPFVSFRPRADG